MRQLIRGARIVTGDGLAPPVEGDVLLEGDLVARLGAVGHSDLVTADVVVEARGRVLAPSFVDTHNHGALGGTAKPTDLTRVGAGPSLSGERQGGDSRHVGPGDVIIIPAGTPHSFSALDSPISYLVFRFDPGK